MDVPSPSVMGGGGHSIFIKENIMSKRFLVQYEGPIQEFVTTVNGENILFHQIKMKGEVDKVAEVYTQEAFNFLLRNMNLTPYSACPEALKQLNKLQEAREKAIEESEKAYRVSQLTNQVDVANVKIDQKQAEVVELLNTAKVVEEEIKDLFDLIPEIKKQIDGILGIKPNKGKK